MQTSCFLLMLHTKAPLTGLCSFTIFSSSKSNKILSFFLCHCMSSMSVMLLVWSLFQRYLYIVTIVSQKHFHQHFYMHIYATWALLQLIYMVIPDECSEWNINCEVDSVGDIFHRFPYSFLLSQLWGLCRQRAPYGPRIHQSFNRLHPWHDTSKTHSVIQLIWPLIL